MLAEMLIQQRLGLNLRLKVYHFDSWDVVLDLSGLDANNADGGEGLLVRFSFQVSRFALIFVVAAGHEKHSES